MDNALRDRTKLESLVEAQKGFEQEARRNYQRCAELKAKLPDERKDAVTVQKKFA
jgi:uncharacterized tellurite resistance protein B-like protein